MVCDTVTLQEFHRILIISIPIFTVCSSMAVTVTSSLRKNARVLS